MPAFKPTEKLYHLTFRDAYTGRSKGGYLRANTYLYEVIDYLEQEGVLSFPARYVYVPGIGHLRGGGRPPEVCDIKGVYSGMTLTLDLYQAHDPELSRSPNFHKTYPLVFYWQKNRLRREKIEFLCYGYEYPADFIDRMLASHALDAPCESGFRIQNWPEKSLSYASINCPLPLCDVDPIPGTAFMLQEYQLPVMPPMYGCPTAALPEQMDALSSRAVDVVVYD